MATSEPERDRIRNPSINFPESEEEAFQAVLHRFRKSLSDDRVLGREFGTDAGLGMTRTRQQADWLNEAKDAIGALVEDLLDRYDARTREDGSTPELPPSRKTRKLRGTMPSWRYDYPSDYIAAGDGISTECRDLGGHDWDDTTAPRATCRRCRTTRTLVVPD